MNNGQEPATKADVAALKGDIEGVKGDIEGLKADVDGIREQILDTETKLLRAFYDFAKA
jgi:hypothetical protein